MELEIQQARLLSFDPSSRSWIEVQPGDRIDGSPDSSHPLPSFTVATWNVWEDERFTEYRHPFVLQKLFDGRSPHLDVITLQEVTTEFFGLILAHPIVQNDWILTDLPHQLDTCPNPYGTVILIRKDLARGYICAAGFHEFENTRMQRGLNFVELCSAASSKSPASRQPILRIGTSHFESHPEDKRKRREQFEVSAEILTTSESFFFESATSPDKNVPAILTGDYNICAYDELAPLLNDSPGGAGFIDAFLAARPVQSGGPPFTSHPTYGITIPNRKMFGKRNANASAPRRLDYVFSQGLGVTEGQLEAGLIGDEPACERTEATDVEGRDGRVYASDHLGVWVRMRPPSER